MSITDAKVIDIIDSEDDGISVTLTATDHLMWGDKEHLLITQEKLNSYLAFIESGEIAETYPNSKDKNIKINLVCKFEPDVEGIVFLAKCSEVIGKAGINFSYRVLEA